MATSHRTRATGDVAHDYAETLYDGRGRARWGAILAGTVVALGVFVLLGVAGVALGFTLFEATEASPMNGALTTTAIWQFVSQLVALGIGGYVAGRLAGVIPSMGAMLHGATVWALATLAAVWFASSTVTGALNLAGSAVSSVASGASSAVSAVIPDDLSLPDLSIGSLSMDDLPESVRSTLRQNGLTPENFQAEAREAFRTVLSQQEQQNLQSQAAQTAQDVITSPGDIGEDVDEFVSSVFGRGGILSEEDRQQALTVLENRFGLTPDQAGEYVDYVQARAERLQQEAEQAIDEARQEAVQAADTAADAAATAAWLAALASLIGLGAAVGGAAAGRVARA